MQTLDITIPTRKAATLKITERVKSFEDACQVLEITGNIFTGNLHDALALHNKAILAHIKLVIITQALNEDWTPNWNNSSEKKWQVYWNMEGGFSLSSVLFIYSRSSVGSRLCFKSEELARYASAQFIELYKEFHTL